MCKICKSGVIFEESHESNSPREVKVFRTVLIRIYLLFTIPTDSIEQIHLIKPVKLIELIEMTGSLMILKMSFGVW